MVLNATEYFRIDKSRPDAARLTGPYNGEFINFPEGYTAHLAPAFGVPEGHVSHRWSKEGNGNIVVTGLSLEAWHEICDTVGKLSVNDQKYLGRVMDEIIQLPYITWDRPHQDIGRLNAMDAHKMSLAV